MRSDLLLALLLFPITLSLFSLSLNEDLLLLLASVLFFSTFTLQLRGVVRGYFISQREEVYHSFAELLSLRLTRFSRIARFGRLLLSLFPLLSGFPLSLFQLLHSARLTLPTLFSTSLLLSIKRALLTSILRSERVEEELLLSTGRTLLQLADQEVSGRYRLYVGSLTNN